jgi:hypothetical protein
MIRGKGHSQLRENRSAARLVVRVFATLWGAAALFGMGPKSIVEAHAEEVVDLGVIQVRSEELRGGGRLVGMRQSLAQCWVDRRECRAVTRSSTLEGMLVEVTLHVTPRAATRVAMIVSIRREGREMSIPGEPIRVSEESFECDDLTLRDGTALSRENVQEAGSGLKRRARDTGQWFEF